MSTSTQFLQTIRRLPRQERAELRIQEIVQAAEQVIGKRGPAGATMTEIAEVSSTSIGAIYQYFPNKDVLINALRSRHLRELDIRLSALRLTSPAAGLKNLSELLVNVLVNFSASFPAYRHLFLSNEQDNRNTDDDARLLNRFNTFFAWHCLTLSEAEIRGVTQTALTIIKGILDMSVRMPWEGQSTLIAEARYALYAYLRGRCVGRA